MNDRQTGLLAALLGAGVEFVVVGGVAVNLHGYSRATNDIDIFFRPTEENARKAFKALQSIAVPMQGLTAEDLLNDEENFRFGPGDDHVDMLASIGEMAFDEAWRDRIEVEWDGIKIPFISKSSLILNKRQTGRLRDLVDVEELEMLPDEL